MAGIHDVRYVTFNTGSDTLGTPQQIAELDNDDETQDHDLALAIDANDDPHVTWRDALTDMGSTSWFTWYSNRISGWSTRDQVHSDTVFDNFGRVQGMMIGEPTAAIGEDRPMILCNADTTAQDINIKHGNALNATSWTEPSASAITNTNTLWDTGQHYSFVIDSNGKITVTWIAANGDLNVNVHLPGDSWNIWSSDILVDSSTDYLNPSMAVIGTNRYIFVENSLNNDITLWKNENEDLVDGDAVFGTDADLPIEEFDTYTDQTDANASWAPTHNAANKRVNVSLDLIDYISVADSSNDSIVYDMGANISNSLWVLQFSIDITALNKLSTTVKELFIGFGDDANDTTDNAQDYLGMSFNLCQEKREF